MSVSQSELERLQREDDGIADKFCRMKFSKTETSRRLKKLSLEKQKKPKKSTVRHMYTSLDVEETKGLDHLFELE